MMIISAESELEEILRRIIIPGETAIIGLGNELRCDDGFGVYVARSLSNFLARYSRRDCLVVIDAGTSLESYLDVLNSKRVCILLDAIEAPASYSEVILLSKGEIMNHHISLSTHTIPINTLLTFVGSEVYIVGTRPVCLGVNLGVTRPVALAIQRIVKAIIAVLKSYGCL